MYNRKFEVKEKKPKSTLDGNIPSKPILKIVETSYSKS
jgi:hypothetical protein